ncbi:YbaB/EbfC family nucleoid-associated protein [Streptosporangium sp. NBC_01639]|uniref:YbaB/EbfC family nucleoid-associated protein n=1 Tax=Streptosporangium sp. NBC_01639 TaxID=2975948 RepID=UPI003865486D|nr:YbaB/EbfC family nucleoid-associated protein [Streptosporangium sp. NBC_01639]
MRGDDHRRTPLDDLVRITDEAEKGQRLLRNAQREIAAIKGEGESASGKVRARVDTDGRLVDVRLDPRATKLSSMDLAEEITLAVQRAQDDAARQRERAFRDAVGAPLPDAAQVLEQFDETMQTFSRAMNGHEARLDQILREMNDR